MQRIAPLQRGEAGEVRVRAVQLVAAADRQSGQVSVGGEIACRAKIAKEIPEQFEVSRRRLGHVHVGHRTLVRRQAAWFRAADKRILWYEDAAELVEGLPQP